MLSIWLNIGMFSWFLGIFDRYFERVFIWSIIVKVSGIGEIGVGSLEFGVIVEGFYWIGVGGVVGGVGGVVVILRIVCRGYNISFIDF